MALTLADVKAMIDKGLNAQAAQKAKADFAAANMKGIPTVYHAQLGDDPSKWPEESKAIRTQFEADIRSLGLDAGKLPVASGDAASDGVTGNAPGSQPRTPEQYKAMGLSDGEAAFAVGLGSRAAMFTPAVDSAGKPLKNAD